MYLGVGYWKGSERHCFGTFTTAQAVNMKIVMELVRNSDYSKSDNFKKPSVLSEVFSYF